MSSQIKFKIGEFSKLAQVTVKTLRHYEEMGIIMPHEVDNFTGYRFYDVKQLNSIAHIQSLKQLGFSLEEIREMQDLGMARPTDKMLDEKLLLCNQELEELNPGTTDCKL